MSKKPLKHFSERIEWNAHHCNQFCTWLAFSSVVLVIKVQRSEICRRSLMCSFLTSNGFQVRKQSRSCEKTKMKSTIAMCDTQVPIYSDRLVLFGAPFDFSVIRDRHKSPSLEAASPIDRLDLMCGSKVSFLFKENIPSVSSWLNYKLTCKTWDVLSTCHRQKKLNHTITHIS